MSELTPRNRFVFPSELEEPYFPNIKAFFLGSDSAHWADAENGNLTFNGGGLFTWSAASSTLTWLNPITITPFTSAQQARAIIAGPPAPGGVLTIEDGQVAFFSMPRLMQQDTLITLQIGTRIYQSNGTRMHDLRLFCARVGSTILFPNGKSLQDGQSAVLFGGGTGSTIPPHVHQPVLIIDPPTSGVSTLDLQVTTFDEQKLITVSNIGSFTLGDVVSGNVSLASGTVVNVQPTYIGVLATQTLTLTLSSATGFTVGDFIQSGSPAIYGVITALVGTSLTARVLAGVWGASGNITDTATSTTTTYSGAVTSTSTLGTFQQGETVTAASNIVEILVSGPIGSFSVNDIVTSGGARGTISKIFGSPTPTSFYVKVTTGFFPVVGTLTNVTSGGTATITNTILIGAPQGDIASVVPPSNLLQVYLFRNGVLQAEGPTRDYTLNYSTGIVTLTVPTVSGSERFVALRETIPIGAGSTEHQHLKLPIPIVVNGTVNLDMQLSSLNPSPNTLVDVNLYRNGALQAQPDDYSLDTQTGIVTLVAPANAGEIFVADRLVD